MKWNAKGFKYLISDNSLVCFRFCERITNNWQQINYAALQLLAIPIVSNYLCWTGDMDGDNGVFTLPLD